MISRNTAIVFRNLVTTHSICISHYTVLSDPYYLICIKTIITSTNNLWLSLLKITTLLTIAITIAKEHKNTRGRVCSQLAYLV